MTMRICCSNPACRQEYQAEPSRVGQNTVCSRCGTQFTIVDPAAATSQLQPPPLPQKSEKRPRLLGRFEIREKIGAGAFGTVYRAYDPALGREVALKVPRAAALENPQARARFLREPRAAAQLQHPHIVPIFDAGSDQERYYIASAFIEGRTLQEVLEKARPDFRRAAEIVRELAEALHYAHCMGVVHRDVKPANVMIDAAGSALLMDFGLAHLEASEEKLTQDGTVMGTPAYMAPEQADRSLGEVGPASDQYALGVVLYELLSGEIPFSGPPAILLFNVVHQAPPPLRAKNQKIPRDIETICLKAMAKKAAERYADCGALAEDLRRWLEGEPIRARRMSLFERAGRWAHRNPVLAGLTAASLVLAVFSMVSAVRTWNAREKTDLALENQRQQFAIVREQRTRAEEQTRLAQQHRKTAQEQVKVAGAALVKLQGQIDARKKAEAERQTEIEKQTQLTGEMKQRETELATAAKALDEAKETAERESMKRDKRAQEAARVAAWKAYVDNLAAADAKFQEKRNAEARELLDLCPVEHRAWEWHFLKKHGPAPQEKAIVLGRSLAPGEKQYTMGTVGAWRLNPDGKWLVVENSTGNGCDYVFYRLPEKSPATRIRGLENGVTDAGGVLISGGHDSFAGFRGTGTISPDGCSYVELSTNIGVSSLKLMRVQRPRIVWSNEQVTEQKISWPFDPGNKFLLAQGKKGFELLSMANGRRVRALSFDNPAPSGYCGAAFTASGSLAVLGTMDKRSPYRRFVLYLVPPAAVADGLAPPASFEFEMGSFQYIPTIKTFFSTDEKRLIALGIDGFGNTVRAYILGLSPPAVLMTVDKPIALSPDHRRVAYLGPNRRIQLLDIDTKNELPHLRSLGWTNYANIEETAFSPDWTNVAIVVLPQNQQNHTVLHWTLPPIQP